MRLENLEYENMNREQKKIHDEISAGPRGSVRGPLAVWMHRPGLADKAQSLGAYCRYNSSLEPILSEFARSTSSVTGRCFRSDRCIFF